MVNGANGVEGGGDGASSSGSDAVTAVQARTRKHQQNDFFIDKVCHAHQPTAPAAPPTLPGRRCFVTVGATAAFASLLDEVASAGFLQSLAENGFTTLDVQCGPGLASFEERMAGISDQDRHGVEVASFANPLAMAGYLHNCRGEQGVRLAGCVIAHGGKLWFHLVSRVFVPSQLTLRPRHGNCRGGPARRRPAHCRRKHDTDGQPPT
jgi:beta-1,4-N-acetylglucosaminyltransferase